MITLSDYYSGWTKFFASYCQLQPLLLPRPSQFPSPSGEVRDLPCVAFPWYSSAGGGSGPGELIGVMVETLDTPPSRQTAVEPRQGQPRLFGWQTTHSSAREVWPLRHTHTHTHAHNSPLLSSDCPHRPHI